VCVIFSGFFFVFLGGVGLIRSLTNVNVIFGPSRYSLTLFCIEISALSACVGYFCSCMYSTFLFYRGTNQVSLVGTKLSSLFTRSMIFFQGCHANLFSFLVSARQPITQDFTIGRWYNKGRQTSEKSVRKMRPRVLSRGNFNQDMYE